MVKEREHRKPWGLLPTPGRRQPHKWPPYSGLLMVVILFVGFLLMMAKKRPFLEFDADGIPKLAPWRQEELERGMKKFDEAEQYVLEVALEGYYPCFHCEEKTIFLFKGEVWKYGVTINGELGRYPGGLNEIGLVYFSEFKGTLSDCLKAEKRKIILYALLPENLKRDVPLIRPPGNKQDR